MQGEVKPQNMFKRQLEKQALRQVVLLVLVGCLLFCIPVFGMNYLGQRFRREEHMEYLTGVVRQVYDSTVAYLDDSDNIARFLRCADGLGDGRKVQYSLSKYNVDSPVKLDLVLIDTNENIAYTSYDATQMNLHREAFSRIVATNAAQAGRGVYSAVYFFPGVGAQWVLAKPLYQQEELRGFVLAYLNGSDWGALISEYQYDSIITDLNGNIIYSSKSAFLPQRSANKFKADTAWHAVQVNGLRYMAGGRVLADRRVVVYSFLYTPENIPFILIGVLTIAFLGALWFLMFLNLSREMARKTAGSVEALVGEMRIIRHGDSRHHIQINTGDEFEEIAEQINRMVKSVNELNTRNTDLIRLNGMIEMRNLQTQINPHFIYNTLDNIKYLITTQPEMAARLMERFTHILRYSINNTKQDVLFSEDIVYIEDYLAIQKTRFGERFGYTMQLAPECSRCMVPKLLLQPLLENSIKYGFQKKMTVAVQIRGWCEGAHFFLQVRDDGPGLPAKQLHELRQAMVSEGVRTEHNGLQNLCRRILLEYGKGCGLFIESEEGRSFTVTAKLLCTRGD